MLNTLFQSFLPLFSSFSATYVESVQRHVLQSHTSPLFFGGSWSGPAAVLLSIRQQQQHSRLLLPFRLVDSSETGTRRAQNPVSHNLRVVSPPLLLQAKNVSQVGINIVSIVLRAAYARVVC